MTPERWEQVRDLLHGAMQLKPAERPAFLDQHCSDDPSLRQELDQLLAAEGEVTSSFLASPAVAQAATSADSLSSAGSTVLVAGTKLGPYVVQALLGAGGMGEVYRARDTRLDRTVAIKIIPRSLSADAIRRQRFEREARAISALQHPNICTLYDIGSHDGTEYLVMEYLEGETLAERLMKGRLPLDLVLRYASEVADALDMAHRRGIIHRDLKPGNIFLTTHGEAKVLDFGLAKLDVREPAADSPTTLTSDPRALTTPGLAMGTVAYMSPEQVKDKDLDARSDLFSFGVVLYQMAAGQLPFRGDTSGVIFNAILERQPVPLVRLNPEIPPKLEEIINKCLEKDREVRCQSAAELRADLKRLKRDTDSRGHSATTAVAQEPSSPRSSDRQRNLIYVSILVIVLFALGLRWYWFKKKSLTPPRTLSERQITHNLSDNKIRRGEISPDGKYIAYADLKGLHLTSIRSGESHEIALPEELRANLWDVTWFPNGENLIIESESESEGRVLWLISVFGGTPRKLRTQSSHAKVSPDGLSIAFVSGHGHEIWLAEAQGENARRLLDKESDEYQSLAWSPSGHRLAYLRNFVKPTLNENFGGSIETLSLNGGSPSVVVSDPGLLMWADIVWLRDERLIFSSTGGPPAEENLNLWAVMTDMRTGLPSGKPTKMTSWSATIASHPSVSRDGSRLVVQKGHARTNAYVGELKDNGTHLDLKKPLSSSDSHDAALEWTRDSGTVLLMSDRNLGRFQVFKQELDADSAELLVSSPDDLFEYHFSPDAKWILYFSMPYGGNSPPTSQRLMRSPASGGSPEQILKTPVDPMILFGCPSRPSNSCLISRGERGFLIFSVLDPLKGQGKEIIRTKLEQANDLAWSIAPDGSRMAIVSEAKLRGQVRILDLYSGAERNLPLPKGWSILDSDIPLSWAADCKALFAGVTTRSGSFIARIDLDGKTHILLEQKSEWVLNPISSPDGRHLAYSQHTTDRNIWLLENF